MALETLFVLVFLKKIERVLSIQLFMCTVVCIVFINRIILQIYTQLEVNDGT